MTRTTQAASAGSTNGSGHSRRPCRRVFGATLALAIAAICLTATPASAVTTHVFSTSFGSSGSGDGQVSSPQGVAVNSTSHDVYVADTGNARVVQFDSTGAFIRAFGADVGGSGVNVCTTGCVAGTPGSGPGAFTTPTFIAVDNSCFAQGLSGAACTSFDPSDGDVYVGDTATNTVSKFSASGAYISTNDGSTATTPVAGPFGPLAGVAADTAGNLWVNDTNGSFFEFAQDSSFITDYASFQATPAGISLDSAGNLYFVFGFSFPIVEKLDPSGNDVGTVTASASATGLAIDPSANDIYVDNGGTVVDHYDSSCSPSGGAGASSCTSADSFGSGHLSGAAGLAVDHSSDTVYAADTGNARIAVFTPPPPIPPTIDSTSAANLAPTSVDLRAQINPNFYDTHYHFEYVDDASFQATAFASATSAPVPDADLGSAATDQLASAHISGLTSGTLYHYRAVADNGNGGPQTGPPHTFVYLTATPGLPDNRAYELVTPPFKGGAPPTPILAVSPDGSRLIIQSNGDFGDAQNNQTNTGAVYETTRTSSGWSSHNIDPPASQFPYDQYLDASSPGLGRSLWYTRASAQSLYALDLMVRDGDGTLHDLGPLQPPSATAGPPGTGVPKGNLEYGAPYSGASADLSHVLFSLSELNQGFWPGDGTDTTGSQVPSLYEYVAGTGGPPALVGVDNSGSQISQCGVRPGSVSAAGSTVFFTAGAGGCGTGGATGPAVGQLFAGIGDPGSGHATVNVAGTANCAASASCDVTSPPGYQGASTDGSKVFFTMSSDIYECDLPGDSGPTPTPAAVVNPCPDLRQISSGANLQSVNAISDDGSHVYFTATGVLTATPNQYGQSASSGANNLYLYERDAAFPAGQTSFISTLNSPSPVAEATPDGRFLAFTDTAQLTPDDTSTALQVFRYDAQSGELVRVSIGESGFNDNGNTNSFDARISPTRFGVQVYPRPLAISNDGAYVVFQSADGLTPGALNGAPTNTPGVPAQNVYSYHDGNVGLISDGQDATSAVGVSATQLFGTTASGADIFLKSANPLVPQDTDTQVDIYDARVGGGFQPGQGAPSCSGDACQGNPTPPPNDQGPGSSSLNGPGNQGRNLGGSTTTTKKKKCKKGKKGRKCRKARHANTTRRAGK